jgi:selenide,water dikinase
MAGLPVERHPDLLVGTETGDDAGVFRLTPEIALVQTLDFLTPIVDSPFDFGRIAAANALSDVYAMGGTPKTAMNIVCFPAGDLPLETLRETLAGGLEKIREAGAVLVGGHSVDDKEFKYGLSVTGLVHPDRVLTNRGARPGDALVLTKPLGAGVLATAVKAGLGGADGEARLVAVASTLNRRAGEILLKHNPSGCTDVTGFGLGGHSLEMARGSGVRIILYMEAVPLIPGALDFARMGLLPAGTHATRGFCGRRVRVAEGLELALVDLAFDPQTSGGLLASLTPRDAARCVEEMRGEGVEAAVVGEAREPGDGAGIDLAT